MIWSLDTGGVRALETRVKYQFGFRWSPDGRFLIAMGNDFRDRRGIYRIDTQTGDSMLVIEGAAANNPDWAPDGQSVYYRRSDPGGMLVIVQRDLNSGAENEVFRTRADNGAFQLSPDRRSIAFSARGDKEKAVRVTPMAGGEARTVLRASDPEELTPASWTADGRSLLVVKFRNGSPAELWLAPVDGGEPRRIEGDISNWTRDGGVRLSPDGRQVTFVHSAGEPGLGIWAFESYLSRLKTSR
jgi:Tol biopolymer transport system component